MIKPQEICATCEGNRWGLQSIYIGGVWKDITEVSFQDEMAWMMSDGREEICVRDGIYRYLELALHSHKAVKFIFGSSL